MPALPRRHATAKDIIVIGGKEYLSRGFIYKKIPMSWPLYSAIYSLLEGASPDTIRGFCHLYKCTADNTNENGEGWIPLCWALCQVEIPDCNWGWLESRGLIEIKAHSYQERLSREYRIKEDVFNHLVEAESAMSYRKYARCQMVNAVTGEKMKETPRNKIRDENDNEFPENYVQAVMLISRNRRRFSFDAVECFLHEKKTFARNQKNTYAEDSDKYKVAYLQWRNNHLCFLAVLRKDARPEGGSIWSYMPTYKPQVGGRASEIKGGFQSCSTEMKQASMKGLEEQLTNFDMTAAHIRIALQLIQEAKIPCAEIESYVQDGDAKYVYARACGLSVKCWKRCFAALFTSASIPSRMIHPRAKKGQKKAHWNSISEYIYEDAGGDLVTAQMKLELFRQQVARMKASIDKWHDRLLEDLVYKPTTRRRDKLYITNRLGMKLCVNDEDFPKLRSKQKGVVASFILVGFESAFIHYFTTLGPQFGFRVVANEYDGVVIEGDTSEQTIKKATELAARYAGLINVELRPKMFVD